MLTAYHILSNKAVYSQLRAEILRNFPDKAEKLDYLTVERLPYLVSFPLKIRVQVLRLTKCKTSCLKEGLRLSSSIIGRLPRVVPAGGAVFRGYTVSAGYKVGMSSWMMHRHPEILPDPVKFDPTRWADPANAKRLNKYLVAFSKDSR